MTDGGRKPSFLETVPGVITAIAALITAFATLITALYTSKIIGQHEEQAKKEAGKEQIENQVKQSSPSKDTITDTASGLMWKRCPEGLSGVNCENGKTEKYPTWDDAVKHFKNVEYAGYSDWRLPTVDELKTLVQCSKGKNKGGDCNKGSEKPTINQQIFPNTEATRFWSGSLYAGNSDFAWSVNFNDGYSVIGYRYGSFAVRLVRAGQ